MTSNASILDEGFKLEDHKAHILEESHNAPMDTQMIDHEYKEHGLFQTLPQELLNHIISYLDSPAPSASRYRNEPTFEITTNQGHDFLKSASKVCWRWRKTAIPLLFKHVCIISGDHRSPLEQLQTSYNELFDFVERYKLKSNIQSFTLCIKETRAVHELENEIYIRAIANSWPQLLDTLDPKEVTIVAPPEVLGLLTHCYANSDDGWLFEMRYHLLHVNLETTDQKAEQDLTPQNGEAGQGSSNSDDGIFGSPPASTLLGARPWTTLLLNEGSFIKSFATYEYFHKRPSGILRHLLGQQLQGFQATPHQVLTIATPIPAMIPPTIRDMSYIAVFPFQTHFQALTSRLPRVDRLYVQFTPQDDILNDNELMQRIDTRDLWMERNHCYTMIMQQLFGQPPGGNFKHLQIFESGDAADEDAWEMAVQFVERQGGWKAESPGVFIKVEKEERRGDEEDGEEMGGNDNSSALSVS